MVHHDEENLEVVPLTSQLSFASQQFSTTPPKSSSGSTSRLNRSISEASTSTTTAVTTQQQQQQQGRNKLAKQGAAASLLGFTGWYFPRYLVSHENGMIHKVPPFQTTAAGDVILDFMLNEPLVEPPTVPDGLLIWSSIYLPLVWMAWMAWASSSSASGNNNNNINKRRRQLHDVHAAVFGLTTAIGLSEGATVLLKFFVQRRRPNFYALCGWSSELLKCTAPIGKIRDANFSFPSGHSSLSSVAMVYLAWFCLSKVVAARGPRWLALSSCVFPVAWALFVGASRLVDHWHHPSDVLAGLLLGSVCGTAAFHTWYPPVWSPSQVVGLPWSLHSNDYAKLPSFVE